MDWCAFLLLGIMIGTITFCMAFMEETISDGIVAGMEVHMQDNLDSGDGSKYFGPWIYYAFICAIFALVSGVMTTYWGQGAAGSGVAELIGYMNGVNYPGFISIPSFVTKIFGVTFAVIGKLCIGKEGPLAHIGAIAGLLVLYTPGLGFEFMRTDEKRRQLAAAGCSAGVSCAFGAPIGGTLFAYEMSKPNTFWRF